MKSKIGYSDKTLRYVKFQEVKKEWTELEKEILKSVKKLDHPSIYKVYEYGFISKKSRDGVK